MQQSTWEAHSVYWELRYAMGRPQKPRNNPTVIRVQCGTKNGHEIHRTNDEKSCALCLDAVNSYQTQRNRSLGVQQFQPAACGTNSGYQRHLNNDETACDDCLAAHRAHALFYNFNAAERARLQGGGEE